ncbi:MAG: penicillin acylase family protein [bacterium]
MKVVHIISLIFVFIFVQSFATSANAQAEDISLIASDGTVVTIHRDSYGVPHITAENEVGVFFGQGFAVAQDRLFQMEQTKRAAEGRLTEAFGMTQLSTDMFVRTMFYTEAERMRQFADLPPEIKSMLEAYRDGINTYLDSIKVNPAKFKPVEFQVLGLEIEAWTVYNSIAIMQFITRRFGQRGGEELTRLVELQQNGLQWLNENRPINDPTAPTTIHATSSYLAPNSWSYTGMPVRNEVIRSMQSRNKEIDSRFLELGIPSKLGSFAVLLSQPRSNTGNVMLLGAPQMGPPEIDKPNVTNEVELNCPTLHAGGMTVAGIPMVIIGHNDHHAWTITTGQSDNSDIYIETTMDSSFSKYFHNSEWLDFEVFEDTIKTPTGEIPFNHFRTVHGPVVGDDLGNNLAFTLKMTFWDEELELVKAVYDLLKATSLEQFETAIKPVPVTFNLFYAGQDQKIKYWHLGKYVDRSQEQVDPRLPHKGDGTEEWPDFLAFEDLPSADFTQQDYFVNWNNKPVNWWNNGDNIPWAGSTRLTTRVLDIDAFVAPITAFTYENLKDVPRQIDAHGSYQQAIELTGSDFNDENIVPPGQSAFISLAGQPSPNASDQWQLHVNWQFKDMEFGPSLAVSVEPDDQSPRAFTLHQNYPNPFNPVTTIQFALPQPSLVTLKLFDVLGREITTLVDEALEAGVHKINLDAKDLASGVYFYRIQAEVSGNAFVQVKKLMLLK